MKVDDWIPTLTHATERDVDLLLVEELSSSIDFITWVAGHVGMAGPIAAWDVKHSRRRTRSRREIDIFVDMNGPGRNAFGYPDRKQARCHGAG